MGERDEKVLADVRLYNLNRKGYDKTRADILEASEYLNAVAFEHYGDEFENRMQMIADAGKLIHRLGDLGVLLDEYTRFEENMKLYAKKLKGYGLHALTYDYYNKEEETDDKSVDIS